MSEKNKTQNQEDALTSLYALLDSMNIQIKTDRGNFKGGLYRHNDSWLFYLNRKADVETKLELIISELDKKNLPREILSEKYEQQIDQIKKLIFK